ncbi:exo-alpha-sialidase [Brachybacterium sp. EF45031]|uniref:sialidase family protein n=1 Tax=Brachybacterium sillae TaxID=2810536 RepID=UPI00217EDE78|nr:sialidase family protein [Brachybacterium sillae]MCS6711396.1 exo-alpha-sialidase [Brachybacterium sillae]
MSRSALNRRALLGTLTGIGAAACAAPALALPDPKNPRATTHGVYEEQILAKAGDYGVANFRIPALAVAPNGDLLAAYDKRPVWGDAPSPNSIWQRRSRDGGRTWEPPTVVHAGLETGDRTTQTGYSDPSYVVDREAGRVLCFHVFSKNQGFWGSVYGNDDADRNVLSCAVSISDDSGHTWTHRSVTTVAKPAEVRSTFATSGAGIQLRYGPHRGRLVQQYAGFVREADGSEVVRAWSLYSDDHGETWQRGAFVGRGMDENKVVELSDGTLMLNSRQNPRRGDRWVAYSHDGGETWTEPVREPQLVDPSCNAHITRAFPDAPEGSAKAKVLLFSNANHPTQRRNGTLWYSEDDGRTWIRTRVFQPGACSYSVVTALGNGEYGLFYEAAGDTLTFARFTLDWVLGR